MALGVAAHHNQLAVLQQHFAFFLRAFVFEGEFAGGAEAQRGDGAARCQLFFVVAVPRHALCAVCIKVEQAGIELRGADGGKLGFYHLFDVEQQRLP